MLRSRPVPFRIAVRATPPQPPSFRLSDGVRFSHFEPPSTDNGFRWFRDGSPGPHKHGAGARIEWFSDSIMLSDRIRQLVFHKENRIGVIRDLLKRHTGILKSHGADVYGRIIADYARKNGMNDAPRQFWQDMRARKIDPLPQTFTIMISVYESQMQRGTAPEPVVRELLDRVVELKDELIAKNMFSTAHANAILNACISSSSVGGFEIGMGIYSILQLNFWEALKKATEISATTSALYNAPHVASIIKIVRSSENSLPIPDLVTYILMMRLLTKCKRNDMFKILTETDFVNSYFIPDDAFVTSLLRHYLTASEKDFKTQLFGFSAAALDMPVLMEYVPLAHRKMVYENRLRECLHKNGNLLVLSPKLLDVFLRAVTKVPVQSVRVDVISELRERGVLNEQNIDDAVARLILAILLNCNDYNGAKSFAEFVHSFAKHKVEESVGIYEDLVSTIAVLAAQEFKIHSTHVRECRRMCNKLTSICEEKRLLAADGSSAVDLTDISGMKQRQRLCFIRFLSNLQTFIVDTGALIKIETDSLDGFGKILIVGLCIAERYVPICLKVVAKQKQGIDNSSFIKFLESSKAVLNEAQKYTAAMTKICDEFEFVKAGGPMEKRIVQWPRMVSDIDWVLKNLS